MRKINTKERGYQTSKTSPRVSAHHFRPLLPSTRQPRSNTHPILWTNKSNHSVIHVLKHLSSNPKTKKACPSCKKNHTTHTAALHAPVSTKIFRTSRLRFGLLISFSLLPHKISPLIFCQHSQKYQFLTQFSPQV